MNRKPSSEPSSNGVEPSGQNGHLRLVETSERNPRALLPLDWTAFGLLCAALIVAALWAGGFATTAQNAFTIAEGPFALFELIGVPLTVGLTACAFLVTAWREWKRPVAIGAVPSLGGAVLLLALCATLSLVRSQALYLSVNALAVLFAALLLGGLLSRLARDRNALFAALLVLIATGSLIAGIGVREYLFKWKEGAVYHRVFSTFINPDFLAGYLLLTLPVTLAAFAATTSRSVRLALGVGLGLQSACLLLTGSRAGAAMLLPALGVWLLLAFLSGAAAGRWKRIGAGLAVFAVGAFLASAPLLSRVVGSRTPGSGTASAGNASAPSNFAEASAAQSHSGNFRRYTWGGTIRMASANPTLGTGIGTFETAYPRYAETAFTAHAHNSYLQWAGETGMLSAALLLTTLAAATAFAANVLFLPRRDPNSVLLAEEPPPAPSSVAGLLAFDEPRLLLAGLLASILASMLHSFIDSDWYVVANTFTLCSVVALLVGLARDLAPLTTQRPRPLAFGLMAGGLVVALFLLWRAAGVARFTMSSDAGTQLLFSGGSPQTALANFREAASADPLNPQPHLDAAQLVHALQEPDEEKRELETAVRLAPTGKTYYRLGQFYARSGDVEKAVAAFRSAREREPNNVQNLRALGDVLKNAGRNTEASEAYHAMTALEDGPYGKVRAVPQMVETEFGFAHAGLADIALAENRPADAAQEDERAAAVLGEFWNNRSLDVEMVMPTEKRKALTDLYAKTLAQWQDALKRQNAPAAQIAAIAARQAQFEKERAQDEAASRSAEQNPGGSPAP